MNNKGKQLLSDLKFYDSYSKYREELGRMETWEESVEDVMQMHYNKFEYLPELTPYLDEAKTAYKEKLILASQRNLQYREAQIKRSNTRLYNCASTYIDRPEVFKEIMFVLLNGCGMGYSVEKRYIEQLPDIHMRTDETITHVVEDSIEGWANALHALLSSFFDGSAQIRFDGSLIRPKGAYISGGFKAPGYEPLRKSLEMVEQILQEKILKGEERLTSLDCHEIICISAEAVLAAGLRRSALICLFDKDDILMLKCKTGDWSRKKPWLSKANNSIKILKGSLSKEEFDNYKEYIKQFGEPGIVLVDDEDFLTNPCAEIGFIARNPKNGKSCITFCNLNEINGGMIITPDKFYHACRCAAILGTLQASYTDMPFLGPDTEELIRNEALLGISITGIMDNPQILLDPEVLRKGAEIVKETNELIASIIGINPAARLTCIKPSGNASVLLGTASGIHYNHSHIYLRIMQMNKNGEMAKILNEKAPYLLEDSVYSRDNNDYAVYIPIEENENSITKDQATDLDFLEAVKCVYQNWVLPGTIKERGYSSRITHNVSNTITVQDWDRVFDYIYDNQESFCGLSFMPEFGDKVYKQSPFTKVMNFKELEQTFGEGILFASGLIVDALHAFDQDLWDACDAVKNKEFPLTGVRQSILIKKDIIRRIKKYAKNYFKGDIDQTIECLKNVHIYHKFKSINRQLRPINFEEIDIKPIFVDVNTTGAMACNGNACEIVRI